MNAKKQADHSSGNGWNLPCFASSLDSGEFCPPTTESTHTISYTIYICVFYLKQKYACIMIRREGYCARVKPEGKRTVWVQCSHPAGVLTGPFQKSLITAISSSPVHALRLSSTLIYSTRLPRVLNAREIEMC